MINLNECKFGDKLRTRDGRMALFLGIYSTFLNDFACVIKGDKDREFFTMFYRNDGKVVNCAFDSEYDIIGKWEDEK